MTLSKSSSPLFLSELVLVCFWFRFSSLKQDAPFVMKKKQNDGTISYEGYCVDLLNEIARNLKFTFDIYTSPDGMYGTETENGTWNGMIGELVNKVCKHTIVCRMNNFSFKCLKFTVSL